MKAVGKELTVHYDLRKSNRWQEFNWPFLEPVDEKTVHGYYDIVTHPMDLGTIKKKLDARQYVSAEEVRWTPDYPYKIGLSKEKGGGFTWNITWACHST